MWFLGSIAGLFISLSLGASVQGALLIAAIGGFVAGVFSYSRKDNARQQLEQAAQKEKAWEKRLQALEARLAKLEKQALVPDVLAATANAAQAAQAPAQVPAQTPLEKALENVPLEKALEKVRLASAERRADPPAGDAQLADAAPKTAPPQRASAISPVATEGAEDAAHTESTENTATLDITQDLSAQLAVQQAEPSTEPSTEPSAVADQRAALNTSTEQAIKRLKPEIQPETASAPNPKPERRPTPKPAPKPVPPKPWRETLPAPLANLLFGGNALVRIGALILFLGLGFLLKYVTADMVVPIEVRYAGVALAGLCLLVVGWRLRHRRTDYGQVLQGAGLGVFYLTAFAATRLHPLLPPMASFAFMALVALLTAILGVLQNAYPLAVAAALGGFAAPVLVSSGGGQALPLLSYLAVLDIGILLVAWFKAWRGLNVIGFGATFALVSGWAQRYYTPAQDDVLQVFLLFFWALFTLLGVLFARRSLRDSMSVVDAQDSLAEQFSQTVRRVGRVDSALVFGVPMAVFGLQYALLRESTYGAALAALGFSFAYLLLAHWVLTQVRRGQPGLTLLAEAYGVVGVIFATLSIPLGLEGLWTGAAWAVEAAGMYWLGQRQARPHARAFAFLVMAGACYKLLRDLAWNADPSQSILTGSSIGPVLLAAAAWVMWLLYRQAQRVPPARSSQRASNATNPPNATSRRQVPAEDRPANVFTAFEDRVAVLLPWLIAAALALLPCLWWTTPAAATGIATLALVLFMLLFVLLVDAKKPVWPGWRAVLASLQVVSVFGFGLSLHFSPSIFNQITRGDQAAVLDDGYRGALQATWIALCLLIPVGWRMAQIRTQALAKKAAPNWPVGGTLALLTGVVLLHLASLFALNLEQVAWVWPLSALVVLWVAKFMAHSSLALFALLLQVVSAVLYWLTDGHWSAVDLPLLRHVGFSTPFILGCAGFLSAWWIWVEAQRETNGARWVCAWMCQIKAAWLPLLWGLSWWLMAWWGEAAHYVAQSSDGFIPLATAHYQAALLLFTLLALSTLARWLRWKPAGQLTLLTLPALLSFAVMVQLWHIRHGLDYVPSHASGYWLWPLACAVHFYLLRQQRQYVSVDWLKPVHLFGFWLFTWLAARECQWQVSGSKTLAATNPLLDSVASPASSWDWLGWVLIPTIVLGGLRNRWLNRHWPLTEFGTLYRETAALPMAIYLLLWVWISNMISAGSATPLPYVPLLNPLELGQLLVLLACALWWRDSRLAEHFPARIVITGLSVFAFALFTGMVLRSVHHFADVPWENAALLRSRVAQAALSISWALCAVGAMIHGHRHTLRAAWLAGAALITVVVIKLFTVDLADHGGLYRVISFMGVGVLILLVGYFAPIPPSERQTEQESK